MAAARIPVVRTALASALAAVILLCCAAPVVAATSPSPAALRPAPVVAILLAPYLTYSDLSPTSTPALWSLAETGAVGSMNSVTADSGGPTVGGGALTLSAGRWAAAARGPADAASLPAQRSANERSLARPVLAALGEALRGAGGRTAAIGSSDLGSGAGAERLRPAELIATDASGLIDFVDADTLLRDADAPFGVRSDSAAQSSAIASALAEIESSPNPGGLLVVDPGDLARAHAAGLLPGADPATVARTRAVALESLDAAAADLASQLPADSLLLVLAPTTGKPYYQPPYLGPIIASGRGLSGSLTSASTHRAGLVANLDVAPTVLAALGVPVPPSLVGQPFSAAPDTTPLAERVASLARANAAVGAVDKLRDRYFTPAFAWFAVLCVGIAVLAAFRPSKWIGASARALLLVVLSAAPAAWIALLVVALSRLDDRGSGAVCCRLVGNIHCRDRRRPVCSRGGCPVRSCGRYGAACDARPVAR